MDDATLAGWRRLAEAATPGPWASMWEDETGPEEQDAPVIVSTGVALDEDKAVVGVQYYDGYWAACTRPNAAFIASAREAVPALLAALDEARAAHAETLDRLAEAEANLEAERAARVADAVYIASIRKNWNDACAENIHLRLARAGAEEAARLATERAAKAETERDEARAEVVVLRRDRPALISFDAVRAGNATPSEHTDPYFTCDKCGGHFFGRTDDIYYCHDQHQVGCNHSQTSSEAVKVERAELRLAIEQVAEALGAAVGPEASHEFHLEVVGEARAVAAKLERERNGYAWLVGILKTAAEAVGIDPTTASMEDLARAFRQMRTERDAAKADAAALCRAFARYVSYHGPCAEHSRGDCPRDEPCPNCAIDDAVNAALSGKAPRSTEHSLALGEGDRQLVLLALAHLANERPGFDDTLNKIAARIDNVAPTGRAVMFDSFKALGNAEGKSHE